MPQMCGLSAGTHLSRGPHLRGSALHLLCQRTVVWKRLDGQELASLARCADGEKMSGSAHQRPESEHAALPIVDGRLPKHRNSKFETRSLPDGFYDSSFIIHHS